MQYHFVQHFVPCLQRGEPLPQPISLFIFNATAHLGHVADYKMNNNNNNNATGKWAISWGAAMGLDSKGIGGWRTGFFIYTTFNICARTICIACNTNDINDEILIYIMLHICE